MNHGKNTCNQLKAIRKQIADANDIAYEPHECTFDGECRGTCPACEGEMRYIERELQRRQSLGKKIAVVGIATGLSAAVATTQQSCGVPKGDNRPISPVYSHEIYEIPDEATIEEGEVPVCGHFDEIPINLSPSQTFEEYVKENVRMYNGTPIWISSSEMNENDEVEYHIVEVDCRDLREDDEVWLIADEMPEFPGGREALRKYLQESIHYPKEAIVDKIQGRVFVSFVVDSDGSVYNVKVTRPFNELLDAESIRIVKSMPRWKPGKRDGVPVKVSYTVPINFRLPENN
ncbi:MAG: energy transducer TonB [Bacteroidales bacterium]|jgi:TonB family protein|nr:energy transducer TonB [Bacteroidales bacterium]